MEDNFKTSDFKPLSLTITFLLGLFLVPIISFITDPVFHLSMETLLPITQMTTIFLWIVTIKFPKKTKSLGETIHQTQLIFRRKRKFKKVYLELRKTIANERSLGPYFWILFIGWIGIREWYFIFSGQGITNLWEVDIVQALFIFAFPVVVCHLFIVIILMPAVSFSILFIYLIDPLLPDRIPSRDFANKTNKTIVYDDPLDFSLLTPILKRLNRGQYSKLYSKEYGTKISEAALQAVSEQQLKNVSDKFRNIILLSTKMGKLQKIELIERKLQELIYSVWKELDGDSKYQMFPLLSGMSDHIDFYFCGNSEIQIRMVTVFEKLFPNHKVEDLMEEYYENTPWAEKYPIIIDKV